MDIKSVVNVNAGVNTGQAYSPPGKEVAPPDRAVVTVSSQAAAASKQPQPAPKPAPEPSETEVREAASKINKVLRSLLSSNLEFSVDQDSGRTIVRVVDVESKTVIRQIPNEEALAIAKSLGNQQGLLIRQKA